MKFSFFACHCVFFLMCLVWTSTAHARNFDAEVMFGVRDVDGGPVGNASVAAHFAYFQTTPFQRTERQVDAETDSSGRALMRSESIGRMRYRVEARGYYAAEHAMAFRQRRLRHEVTLRDIRDPVPMAALQALPLPLPAQQQVFGLDLMKMDWMPPHGEGEVEDIRLGGVGRQWWEQGIARYSVELRMTFLGEGNGMQEGVPVGRPIRSVFMSDYDAPASGYDREFRLRTTEDGPDVSYPVVFFRIRSEMTEEGEPTAYYGKIYNIEVEWDGERPNLLISQIYINLERDNRNMEFDPRRNLAERIVVPRWNAPRHLNVAHP